MAEYSHEGYHGHGESNCGVIAWKTFGNVMIDMYEKYGYYKEKLGGCSCETGSSEKYD